MLYQGIVLQTTGSYESELQKLCKALKEASSIVIGAGSGLSTSAGFEYSGERFDKNFSDFSQKYHFKDMYSGGFTDFESPEEKWAYFSRLIWYNRYSEIPKDTLARLRSLVEGKDFFVLTTNVDHTFQKSGFPKEKLFYTQGDYGLLQCSVPCHQKTYDNYEIIQKMIETQSNMKIPTELIPHCPKCGKVMSFNLFSDDTFVRDEGWHAAHKRYQEYLFSHQNQKVLYLELGVGFNSPGVIKFPFWEYTEANPQATFASINLADPSYHLAIKNRSIIISHNIDDALKDLEKLLKE